MLGGGRGHGERQGREAAGRTRWLLYLTEITRYKLLSLGGDPVTNSDSMSIRGDKRGRRRTQRRRRRFR